MRRSTRPAPASRSDEVLDADARLALEVDAGLHREDGRARQRTCPRRTCRGSAPRGSRVRSRGPVPWPKCSPCPASDDDRPSHRVDGPAARERPAGRHGRLQRLDRRRLGPRDELVDLEVARRRLADEQRPGHVAPVAVDLRPEVEQQDRAVERPAVAAASRAAAPPAGRTGTRRRRRAPRRRRSRISHSSRQRELRLGDARPDLGQQRGERPVRDRAGRGDPLDLGRLLDRAVGLDPALDRDELDVRARPRRAAPRSRARRTRPRRRRAAPRRTPTSSGQRAGRSW